MSSDFGESLKRAEWVNGHDGLAPVKRCSVCGYQLFVDENNPPPKKCPFCQVMMIKEEAEDAEV